MRIIIDAPEFCRAEIEYSLNLLFEDFLGLDFKIVFSDRTTFRIRQEGTCSCLTLSAVYFQELQNSWLSHACLPRTVATLRVQDGDSLPVLFGTPDIEYGSASIGVGVDIVGTIFFMVSRIEEAVVHTRDEHNRFPAHASIAAQYGFLHRPIVDEYTDLLWDLLLTLFPKLCRKERRSGLFVTCDLDWPFDPTLYSVKVASKAIFRAFVRDKSFGQAFRICRDFVLTSIAGKQNRDGYYNHIAWIMDQNEQLGQQVTFFVIPLKTDVLDPDNELTDPKIRRLLREIYARGHNIGVHPGYNCYMSLELLEKSVDLLRGALADESISQSTFGCRMHYLRWDALTTPGMIERCGLEYDSSLGFADSAGFRCGTAHEFRMYNLVERRAMTLRQRPLIAMESSIIAERYEGLGYSLTSLERFLMLRHQCFKYKGQFTFLWHNSHFESPVDRAFYQVIINRDLSGADLAEKT